MSSAAVALTILGMGIITYLIRVSLFLASDRITLPPRLLQALRYVPASVLSAIIFPEMFMPDGVLDISFDNVRLLAGILAALVAWRTRSALLTVAAGMLALWLLTWLLD